MLEAPSSSTEPAALQPHPADANEDDTELERQWPVALVEEHGISFHARIQGPHLHSGRFTADTTSESSESSSTTTDDDVSLNSWTWSETSLSLDRPCLREAIGVLLGQHRLELKATEPDISSRSQGGRVGAFRRRLADQAWWEVQHAAGALQSA